MHHRTRTSWIVFLIALTGPAPQSIAGPTWIESVEVDYRYDPDTGGIDTFTYSSVVTGGTFGVASFQIPRDPDSEFYYALVDYQGNPGPVTLYVTAAEWNFNLGVLEPVPLDVGEFPASPQPPVIDSPPTGIGGEGGIEIPAGIYSSHYYPIVLSGDASDGGVCFLLATSGDLEYGPGSIGFSVSQLPEPSSLLMLGVAAGFLAFVAPRSWRARRC